MNAYIPDVPIKVTILKNYRNLWHIWHIPFMPKSGIVFAQFESF